MVFLVTGGGNVVNDYFDRDIDTEPAVPPCSKRRISPVLALRWSFLLFLLGSAWPDDQSALPRPGCCQLLLLVAHARIPEGNAAGRHLTVAYLTGSTFLFGGLATGVTQRLRQFSRYLPGLPLWAVRS